MNPESIATQQRRVLLECFQAAVTRSQARDTLLRHLPPIPAEGRLLVIAAGKAAAHMASTAELHYAANAGSERVTGIVVVPREVSFSSDLFSVMQASHPLPDDSSEAAALAVLREVSGLEANDHVVVLLSGGASSLLCAPVEGITLDDKRAATSALFAAGATIDEINVIRKRLSAIKGGKLARACYPAGVTTLAISDVVGDDPQVIGSGPTVIVEHQAAEARRIVDKYDLALPSSVDRIIENGDDESSAPVPELIYTIVAKPLDALQAAAQCASSYGYGVETLGDDIEGEARVAASEMAALLEDSADGEKRAYISGGEVTVTFSDSTADSYGGPNREFALALATFLPDDAHVTALVADTDGVDGQSGSHGPVAGAFVDSTTSQRAADMKLNPTAYLDRHDSGTFFEQLRDELVTGPTDTNVNDFRMLLVN